MTLTLHQAHWKRRCRRARRRHRHAGMRRRSVVNAVRDPHLASPRDAGDPHLDGGAEAEFAVHIKICWHAES